MNGRDDFDGGKLLELFGFGDDELHARPAAPPREEPAYLPPQPQPWQQQAAPPPRRPSPPPTPPPTAAQRRRPADFRNLTSEDLIRSIVLADVLGPPPGKRALRRRR
jgi:hypothetical protein